MGKSVTKDLRVFMETGGPWFDYDDLLKATGVGKTVLNKRLYYLLQRGDIVRDGGASLLSECNFMLKSRDVSEEQFSGPTQINTEDITRGTLKYVPPTTEPECTFKVLGSIIDPDTGLYGGTVVRMTGPGWSDRPYLVKEL